MYYFILIHKTFRYICCMKSHEYYISAIAVACVTIIYLTYRIQAKDKLIIQKESIINEKNAVITYHTNKEGKIVAEKDAAVLRAKDLAEAYPKIAETLERSFDVKVKNLKAYMENAFAAQGKGTGTVVNNHYYDSATNKMVSVRDFHMDDGYLVFDTKLFDSLSTEAEYTYTYTDTVTTVLSSTKKWYQVFKNEKIIGSTKFSNPASKSVSMTSILTDNTRDKRWNISIGITAYPVFGDDGFKVRVTPGLSAGYSLFKF